MDRLLFLCMLFCLFLLQCPSSFSLKSLTFLGLGSNLLEGPLPPSLCNLKNLQYLLLSNNKLTGTIPPCFGNISSQLTVLDLRKNRFHGKIPTNFAKCNQLRNLGLNGNQLEGPIPPSLINCKSLEVLDLGHNKISDAFPMFLATLPKLSVLMLAYNKLYGTIGTSKTKSPFMKLRIFEISYNQFTGSIPEEMIRNFQAMKSVDNNETQKQHMGDGRYYDDSVTLSIESVTLIMKNIEYEIKRVFRIYTTIDLSRNLFGGKIPNSIGDLRSLKVLNFSHNFFNGSIPPTIGDLSELESLDLSWNQLQGKIPAEFGKLYFLEVLNLSQNHLVGRIPLGDQVKTFSSSSFSGNEGLCGFPLEECGISPPDGSEFPTHHHHHTDFFDLTSGFTWKSVFLGYCFGTIFGLYIGLLMLSTRTPKWFVTTVEDLINRNRRRSRGRGLRWHKIN